MIRVIMYKEKDIIKAYKCKDAEDYIRVSHIFVTNPDYEHIATLTEWEASVVAQELEREIKRKVWNV